MVCENKFQRESMKERDTSIERERERWRKRE